MRGWRKARTRAGHFRWAFSFRRSPQDCMRLKDIEPAYQDPFAEAGRKLRAATRDDRTDEKVPYRHDWSPFAIAPPVQFGVHRRLRQVKLVRVKCHGLNLIIKQAGFILKYKDVTNVKMSFVANCFSLLKKLNCNIVLFRATCPVTANGQRNGCVRGRQRVR
jgi:hypothetical protein